MWNVGRTTKGYCGGYFGKFDWSTKEVIAEGRRWILFEYVDEPNENDEDVVLINFESEKEKNRLIEEWCGNDY